MTLIYRTDRTRVPVTQRGVSRNEGEGWGTHLALFKTDSCISARCDVPHAEEILPMMHNMRPNPMPTLQYCAQQEFLWHLAGLAGVNAVTVWAGGKTIPAPYAYPGKAGRVVFGDAGLRSTGRASSPVWMRQSRWDNAS